jgi:hypothetical protein
MSARVLTLAQRKRTLAAALGLVLAASFIYAGNVNMPARLSQHPSDSHGSPMLVVTAPAAVRAKGENASRRAEARRKASTATAWTSAREA